MGGFLAEPPWKHGEPRRVGVLLMNLGTPDAPTAQPLLASKKKISWRFLPTPVRIGLQVVPPLTVRWILPPFAAMNPTSVETKCIALYDSLFPVKMLVQVVPPFVVRKNVPLRPQI